MSNLKIVDVPVEDRIDALADRIVQLKGEKQDIQNKIDECQAALIDIVGIKDEGSQSFHTERYLVGTTQNITRTLDRTEVLKLADRLPEDTYKNVFTWKPALDLANYRALKDMAPNLASMVDDAITSKPSKPAVKVEAKS
jgi:hypothetical protein